MFESRRPSTTFDLRIVERFRLSWGDVSDRLQKPMVVEPGDPFERGIFDGLPAFPWPSTMDHLGLVEAIDRLGERIVVSVSDTPDRSFDARLGQAFGIADRNILGGIKRSSQHSEVGGCDEHSKAAISTVRTSAIAIARTAACCGAR